MNSSHSCFHVSQYLSWPPIELTISMTSSLRSRKQGSYGVRQNILGAFPCMNYMLRLDFLTLTTPVEDESLMVALYPDVQIPVEGIFPWNSTVTVSKWTQQEYLNGLKKMKLSMRAMLLIVDIAVKHWCAWICDTSSDPLKMTFYNWLHSRFE